MTSWPSVRRMIQIPEDFEQRTACGVYPFLDARRSTVRWLTQHAFRPFLIPASPRILSRFGNTISFSHRKTRRTWKPNVQLKSLWSETLDRWDTVQGRHRSHRPFESPWRGMMDALTPTQRIASNASNGRLRSHSREMLRAHGYASLTENFRVRGPPLGSHPCVRVVFKKYRPLS